MPKPMAPDKLLRALIEKGTQAPLSETEIATIYSIIEASPDERVHPSGPDDDRAVKSLKEQLKHAQASLARERSKSDRLQQTLNALYKSTSWKASAPLRKAVNTLRRTPHESEQAQDDVPPHKHDQHAPIKPSDKPPAQPVIIPPAPVYTPRKTVALPETLPASLYAFYLPQFHPIAENDAWWGEGFTEWTNVRPAQPQFTGHYQPHAPDPDAGLGYYDLRESDVMRRQIALANDYGIEGFCFYFYWFAGHRLLETPLLNLLDDPSLNVPFCLCWANENWSRRWDGRDDDVLMAQDHSAADDLAFIEYVSKYLKDPRYRRIDGKPLLLVYRPIELPDAKATAKRWRDWCGDNGVGEIYLAYTQSFENNDPREYGFDGAVEFPPNNSAPPDLTDRVDAKESFTGKVYDWDIFPTRSDNLTPPSYPLFRSVCPAWDNTARRKDNGTVFINSTPERYTHWLTNVLKESVSRLPDKDNRLVFVNAWNEWAEGAHLEPDAAYGYGYLEATRQALLAVDPDGAALPAAQKKRIVLVSHDAHPMGAQILTLNMTRTLQDDFGYEVELVTLNGGPMMDRFEDAATVHNLDGSDPAGPRAKALAAYLAEHADVAICNTTVSGLFGATLRKAGFRIVSLIHELPDIITRYGLERHADAVAAHADKVVFPAQKVRNSFEGFTGPLHEKAVIRPQGAYKRNRFKTPEARTEAAARLRETLGLPSGTRIVLGVGYADHRKGFDLFLDAADALAVSQPHIVFLWLGHFDPQTERDYEARMAALVDAGHLILPGRVTDTDMYYAGADVFLLTSREDPYPSTVLEALDVGVPTIGFADATGSVDLIAAHHGHIVPAFDVDALVAATKRVLVTAGPAVKSDIIKTFRARDDIGFAGYVRDLLVLLGEAAPSISAVVPNYNYAHFLRERIASITEQTHAVAELVLLDDASTDDSRAVMDDICTQISIPVKRLYNDSNSGSVFKQWLRGVEAASSDYVWIAEADDLAERDFLQTVMHGFDHRGVVLAYTQSRQIAQDGHTIDADYSAYQAGVDAAQWQHSYSRGGAEEIANGLSIKNVIPNVSGVVFHRATLLSVLRDHFDHILSFRVAGDWSVYVHMMQRGGVYYDARALNLHRRHEESVTLSKFTDAELSEIKRMQDYVQTVVDVPGPLRAKADAYIEELKQQFGLG